MCVVVDKMRRKHIFSHIQYPYDVWLWLCYAINTKILVCTVHNNVENIEQKTTYNLYCIVYTGLSCYCRRRQHRRCRYTLHCFFSSIHAQYFFFISVFFFCWFTELFVVVVFIFYVLVYKRNLFLCLCTICVSVLSHMQRCK